MTGYKVNSENVRYAGFNIRIYANLIDTILLLVLTVPVMLLSGSFGYVDHPAYIQQALSDAKEEIISQAQFFRILLPYLAEHTPMFLGYMLVDFVVIGAIFIGFWKWKNSTPGKILFKIAIVDGKSFGEPSTKQYMLRYIGYIISFIPLMLGFLIIAFNKKKLGLHDLIAGTAVIHLEPSDPEKEKKIFKYKTLFFLIVILIFAIMVASK